MIFIGKNYDGKVISIISAQDERSANAYWQGKDIFPHSITRFDMNEERENEQAGFVTPLLETKEVDAYHFRNSDKKLLLVS